MDRERDEGGGGGRGTGGRATGLCIDLINSGRSYEYCMI